MNFILHWAVEALCFSGLTSCPTLNPMLGYAKYGQEAYFFEECYIYSIYTRTHSFYFDCSYLIKILIIIKLKCCHTTAIKADVDHIITQNL